MHLLRRTGVRLCRQPSRTLSTFGYGGVGEDEGNEEGHFQKSSTVMFDFMDSLNRMTEVKQAIRESTAELDRTQVTQQKSYDPESLQSILEMELLDSQVDVMIVQMQTRIKKLRLEKKSKLDSHLDKPQQMLDTLIVLNQLSRVYYQLKDGFLTLSQIEQLQKPLIFSYYVQMLQSTLASIQHAQSVPLLEFLQDALDQVLIQHVELHIRCLAFQTFYQSSYQQSNLEQKKYYSLYFMLTYGLMSHPAFLGSPSYQQITAYVAEHLHDLLAKMQTRNLLELLSFYTSHDQKEKEIIQSINRQLLAAVSQQWQYNDMVHLMLLNTLIRKNRDIHLLPSLDYTALENSVLSFPNLELYLSRSSYITSSRDGILVNEVVKSNIQKHHQKILDVKCIVFLMIHFKQVEKIPANLDHLLYEMICHYPYKLDPYLVCTFLINQISKVSRPAYLPYFIQYLTYLTQLLALRNIDLQDNTRLVTREQYLTALNLSYMACKLSLEDNKVLQSALPTLLAYLQQNLGSHERILCHQQPNSKGYRLLREQLISLLYSLANSHYPSDFPLLQHVLDLLKTANYFYRPGTPQNEQLLICRQLVVMHCKAMHYGYQTSFLQQFGHHFTNLMDILQAQIQTDTLASFSSQYLNCLYQFIIQNQIIFGNTQPYATLYPAQMRQMQKSVTLKGRRSFFQEDVKTCLKQIGLPFQSEKQLQLYQCDFYLPQHRLVIEAMGDIHYTRFSHMMKMKDRVKQIQMEFLGYKYLVVNCYEFNADSQGVQAEQRKVMETLLKTKIDLHLQKQQD